MKSQNRARLEIKVAGADLQSLTAEEQEERCRVFEEFGESWEIWPAQTRHAFACRLEWLACQIRGGELPEIMALILGGVSTSRRLQIADALQIRAEAIARATAGDSTVPFRSMFPVPHRILRLDFNYFHTSDSSLFIHIHRALAMGYRWQWWNNAGRVMIVRRLLPKIRAIQQSASTQRPRGPLKMLSDSFRLFVASIWQSRVEAIRETLSEGDGILRTESPGPVDGWDAFSIGQDSATWLKFYEERPPELSWDLIPDWIRDEINRGFNTRELWPRNTDREVPPVSASKLVEAAQTNSPAEWRGLPLDRKVQLIAAVERELLLIRASVGPMAGSKFPITVHSQN